MRILAFDVENLPNITSTFKLFDTNISHTNIIENQSLISISWKFIGKGCKSGIQSVSIADDPERFKDDIYDDYHVAKTFHEVLNSKDDFVLMGHNLDRFDIKKFNTSALKHGLCAVPERQSIDTLKQARRKFKLDSNKLDYLARFLGVGEKIQTGGFQLWNDIVQAKYPAVGKKADPEKTKEAMRRMVLYNKHDVRLLIAVYEKMKGWIKIPNWTLYNNVVVGCTKCGSKTFCSNGHRYTQTGKHRRFWCKSHKGPFDVPASRVSFFEEALGL